MGIFWLNNAKYDEKKNTYKFGKYVPLHWSTKCTLAAVWLLVESTTNQPASIPMLTRSLHTSYFCVKNQTRASS